MFQRKNKAITFSYDDGVTQDRRLIELFGRYGLKATFNLNSGLLGLRGEVPCCGTTAQHNKVQPEEVRSLYTGHEIAVHTLTHPNLTEQTDEEIVRQVEEDRLRLSELAGYEVFGMAYPCGGVNNNDHAAQVIRERTGVKYSRTITSTHSFAPQDNLYRFNPTVYHLEWEQLFALGEQFVAMQPDTPQLFYVWGHSYEFDAHDTWGKFEEFCRLIAGHDDIFYGTNREVLGI